MKEGQPKKRETKVFLNAAEASQFAKSGNADRGTITFGTDSIKFTADKPAPAAKPDVEPKPSSTTPDRARESEEQRSARKWFTERYSVID